MTHPVDLARVDLRGRAMSTAELRAALPRGVVDATSVEHQVRPVVEAVRARGVAAAMEFTDRFDGVVPAAVRVPTVALADAVARLDPQVRTALEVAVERTRRVHGDQKRPDVTTEVIPGGAVTERWVPIQRVGLYVPGGNAVYPSSVVMNVVPAQTAGVESLVIASPPQREFGGLPHPTVLAAAALLGVTEVWALGGAQAIALLGYGGIDTDGTELPPVDLITGPGNIYVTAAKRLCRPVVGIDAEAGPTEIAILADATADPVHVAADLISQAEHDVHAASVLVTDSIELAHAVQRSIHEQLAMVKHRHRVTEALTGTQSAIVVVDTITEGLRVVNAYAAEHLEIHTADAATVAAGVRNAGAVFVGAFSPVSLGDYCAGSNHVLPTAGCARYCSGLSVQTFLRGIQFVEYSREALAQTAAHVVALAAAEDLPAHGRAVEVRFETRS